MTDDPIELSPRRSLARDAIGPFVAALKLTALLAVIAMGFAVYSGPPPSATWTVWRVTARVTGIFGTMLPFGAFAAGLATLRHRTPHKSRLRATIVAAAVVTALCA